MTAPEPDSLPCGRCGAAVDEGFEACWRCGTPLPESALAREPGPDLEEHLAADRAAAAAELRALAERPPGHSLRAQLWTGVVTAFLSLAFTTGLVDARGAAARRILVDPSFWRALLLHVALLGLYVGGVALWRRWRRPGQQRARVG